MRLSPRRVLVSFALAVVLAGLSVAPVLATDVPSRAAAASAASSVDGFGLAGQLWSWIRTIWQQSPAPAWRRLPRTGKVVPTGGCGIGALRHLCGVYVRRQRRVQVLTVDEAQLERLAGTAAENERHGVRLDLQRLVQRLTPRHRRLVGLSFWLGLDARELAQALGGGQPASFRSAHAQARDRAPERFDGGGEQAAEPDAARPQPRRRVSP